MIVPAVLIIALAMGVNLLFDSGARAAARELPTRKQR